MFSGMNTGLLFHTFPGHVTCWKLDCEQQPCGLELCFPLKHCAFTSAKNWMKLGVHQWMLTVNGVRRISPLLLNWCSHLLYVSALISFCCITMCYTIYIYNIIYILPLNWTWKLKAEKLFNAGSVASSCLSSWILDVVLLRYCPQGKEDAWKILLSWVWWGNNSSERWAHHIGTSHFSQLRNI